MTPMVRTQNLRKSFRRADGSTLEAVKGVDLEIHPGEIFSLLGPNGAGKTTTISMISGLIEPTAGDAWIDGHSITKDPLAAKTLMGFVPQEIALYPQLSARQNLAFFGKMYGMGGKDLKHRIDEVLTFLELSDRQHDRIDTFSGGMKRRVNIGVGLLHRPRLVYMDEPTVGIDPQSRRRILDMVKQLRDEQGITILYTTHLMEEAQELSDRVGIIDHGEIIALGTQDELTRHVGEEDRLEFSVGSQHVAPELIQEIPARISGVTRALYTPAEPVSEGSSQIIPAHITAFTLHAQTVLPALINLLDRAGVEIQSVEIREPDLEAVFLALTGRALRD